MTTMVACAQMLVATGGGGEWLGWLGLVLLVSGWPGEIALRQVRTYQG